MTAAAKPPAAQQAPAVDLEETGTQCRASRGDGECHWKDCPQERDGEPRKSGRHCPLDLLPAAPRPPAVPAEPMDADEGQARHLRTQAAQQAPAPAAVEPLISPFKLRAADALADEVAALVRRHVIDSRSPAADALLDYRDPPSSPRADRLALLERERDEARRQRDEERAGRHDLIRRYGGDLSGILDAAPAPAAPVLAHEPGGWITYLVVRQLETDPPEVFPFRLLSDAAAFYDQAQMQWAGVYLCQILLAADRPHDQQPAPPVAEQGGEGREALLLASYCGDDNPACSDARPCAECLALCNVVRVSERSAVDLPHRALLTYVREYGAAALHKGEAQPPRPVVQSGSEGEPLTLDRLLRTVVQVALTENEGFGCATRAAAEDRALDRVQVLLDPAARLALAAELLRGLAQGTVSIGSDLHLKARADFDALVQAFAAEVTKRALDDAAGLRISHTASIGGWVTIFFSESATAESLAALAK